MESMLTALYEYWSEYGPAPMRGEVNRLCSAVNALLKADAPALRVEEACNAYAAAVEQQAFEMGFACAAALQAEFARHRPLEGFFRSR